MKKNNINIIVEGRPGDGKSRLIFLLKDFLNKEGFETEILQNKNFECSSEEEFNKKYSKELSIVLDTMKERKKIIFVEKQMSRSKC